jgi:hypothetical protein
VDNEFDGFIEYGPRSLTLNIAIGRKYIASIKSVCP